jgi:DNA-binding winged helix-turn-helix (wHTH) protein
MLKLYRFGQGLELVPEARELRRAGRPVHVQPKPFDVLIYLLRNRGRVISRDELRSAVWPDVVVNPEALNYALHAARKAVGDDGSKQQVIQTIPRCGFRFVASVEELEQEEEKSRLAGAAGGAGRGPGQRLQFVGRKHILFQTSAALGDVIEGRGQIVLLSGEAGIGKTRTAEELAGIARERGCRVYSGRCVEAEGSPAFWPWIQIVRSFAQEELPESLMRVVGEGAQEVARMVPELREQLPNLPDVGHVDPKAARFLLFDGVIAFFRRAAEAGPMALIFDDLHRADQPSLLLLQFLAREISTLPLLVIGTYREAELRRARWVSWWQSPPDAFRARERWRACMSSPAGIPSS